MNSKLALYYFLLIVSILSCKKAADPLALAKEKLSKRSYLSYVETMYAPIPETDLVTTRIIKTTISYDESDSSKFDYIKSTEVEDMMNTDITYLNGELKEIDHLKETVRTFVAPKDDSTNQFMSRVNGNIISQWSPTSLLEQNWKIENDTVIEDQLFHAYSRLEREYVFEGNEGRVEHHIFISPENYLLERGERRNIRSKKIQQKVTWIYSDYVVKKDRQQLSYSLPENYMSAFGEEPELEPLKVGDKAPDFLAVTMEGTKVELKDFKGKKVLLNFSVISCGYCMQALNRFNEDGFSVTDEIPIFYINPEDDEARMRTFMENRNIPFPVIADAEAIREKYRLNSYPRYFLVNEEGYIEEIQKGYSESFIDRFRL